MNVEARFSSYARRREAVDVEEQSNFTEKAALALRGWFSNGGHIEVPYFLERPGVRYQTCFLSVEIDRLSNPMGAPDTPALRGGIEYDARGAPIAYHIQNYHPGDWLSYGMTLQSWERIPAKMPWGRRRVLHCFDKTRAGQSRGVSALAPVLRDFKSLARFRQAALNTAVSHAMTTFFLETQFTPDMIAGLFGDTQDYLSGRREAVAAPNGARDWLARATMDQNVIVPLFPGDKLVNPRTDRPNDQFGAFSESVLRHIGAALGVSYETLLRDFSRTNYSSARAAMLMDWKRFLGLREWITASYATPAYVLWLEEAINAGDVEAPDFYDNVDAYAGCGWTGAGRGWVDPAKEAAASGLRMQNGISNQQMEAAEQGQDWEQVQEQRGYEIRNAFDIAQRMRLPEAAAYSIAGLTPPKDPLLTTPIGRAAGIGDPLQTEDSNA
jgi:lambda family phage portal protein